MEIIEHRSPFSLTDQRVPPDLSIHYDLSWKLTRTYGTLPGECYHNVHACLLSLRLPQMSYAEGWMVWQHVGVIKVIEHAWLELPELGILDPSIVWHVDEHSAKALRFFAALRYSDSELASHHPERLPTARYHEREPITTGLEQPLYRAAYQQAISYARMCASRTDPPKDLVILPACQSGEEEHYSPLRLPGSGLRPVNIPDGMEEYVL